MAQGVFLRVEYPAVLQPEGVAHPGTYAVEGVVQGGVHGIDGDPGAQGPHDGTFYIGASRQAFQPREDDRVEGDDEVAAFFLRFGDYFFQAVVRHQDARYLGLRLAYQQPGVVESFGVGARSEFFQCGSDVPYRDFFFHRISFFVFM